MKKALMFLVLMSSLFTISCSFMFIDYDDDFLEIVANKDLDIVIEYTSSTGYETVARFNNDGRTLTFRNYKDKNETSHNYFDKFGSYELKYAISESKAKYTNKYSELTIDLNSFEVVELSDNDDWYGERDLLQLIKNDYKAYEYRYIHFELFGD